MFPKAQKTILMGLGGFEHGSGIASAKFLLGKTPELIITDLKTEEQLKKQIKKISAKGGSASGGKNTKKTRIVWHLGGHQKTDFESVDWVVRNPDVPPGNVFLTIARKRHLPIDNDITLFFRVNGVKNVVGVTGTRGKSTTAALTHAMLKNQFPKAKLGGNIGKSPLDFAKNVKCQMSNVKCPVVLELSNFQLSDLPTIKQSPHVAVWTNLYPDHLNKYHSIKEYIGDKKNIFKFQKPDDITIFNWDNAITKKIGQSVKNSLFFSLKKKQRNGAYTKNGWFIFVKDNKETKVAKVTETKLLGEHNQMNTLAAICAAHAYGADWPAIKKAIREFKGVPNRLEILKFSARGGSAFGGKDLKIKRLKDLTFINDCAATSPQATIAALKSLPKKKIILISGGNSKGSNLKEMAEIITQNVRQLILVPGNANSELLKYLNHQSSNLSILQVNDLKKATETACKNARAGEIILLSPGLTWLPLMNEFERGIQFKALIRRFVKIRNS